MTVGKAAPRRPVATGCGASAPKTTPKKPAPRTAVSTGCGASSTGGWKAKTVSGGKSGKTTGLSERAKQQLEKAKTTGGGRKPAVTTGCAPSKPARPAPAPAPKPARTGC